MKNESWRKVKKPSHEIIFVAIKKNKMRLKSLNFETGIYLSFLFEGILRLIKILIKETQK